MMIRLTDKAPVVKTMATVEEIKGLLLGLSV
jgi:hypothetical protein